MDLIDLGYLPIVLALVSGLTCIIIGAIIAYLI